jgi:hypothetical protein
VVNAQRCLHLQLYHSRKKCKINFKNFYLPRRNKTLSHILIIFNVFPQPNPLPLAGG